MEIILQFLPLIVIITLLLFLVVRPRVVERKRLKAMRFALRIGDRVVTVNGTKGSVANIAGDDIAIVMDGSNAEMVFSRDFIIRIETPPAMRNGSCSNCGTAIAGGGSFCSKCGAQASGAQGYSANATQYGSIQDGKSLGFAVLGFFIPLVGLILYLVWKKDIPLRASSAGKGAIIGVIVSVILGIVIPLLLNYQ